MLAIALLSLTVTPSAADRPNVLIVITDDQGYGDLACHGNPYLKTPHLDRLHEESVRLTDFHVDPTCSPTRSALMTGRYSTRTGVWHTIAGRSLLRPEEVTVGDVFTAAGYQTAMFGKWHLGDTPGLRPWDRGFETTLMHGGGGITQTPDFWGNDYFDDVYLGSPAYNGGRHQQFNGYCTDVWFDEAWKWIEAASGKDEPWLCYLATNAPHGPFIPPKGGEERFAGMNLAKNQPEFFAMIENIDENMGRMRDRLEQAGLADDTLFVYLTDNGTARGWAFVRGRGQVGHNAGMNGTKGSPLDGGHRVPCFWHWPGGNLTGGRDVNALTAHIDVLPTLVDLCGLKTVPEHPEWDGVSLAGCLQGECEAADRTLLVHSQRIQDPVKFRNYAVMTKELRLVGSTNRKTGQNTSALYDMTSDPGQKQNVADARPGDVEQLAAAYDAWWESLRPSFDTLVALQVSPDGPTHITCHDWHSDDQAVPWNQPAIQKDPAANGWWQIEVPKAGTYRIRGRMRPFGTPHSLPSATATFTVGPVSEAVEVAQDAPFAEVSLTLPAGTHRFETELKEEGGKIRGFYFVEFDAAE